MIAKRDFILRGSCFCEKYNNARDTKRVALVNARDTKRVALVIRVSRNMLSVKSYLNYTERECFCTILY